jgi:4-hydroxyphenylacetate 3-hydroxylase, reductase component
MHSDPSFDTKDLRKALGKFATGVTVVTTLDRDGQAVGVTANSFSSVSLEPPIVLWSLKRSSPSLACFDHTGRFTINVLTLSQLNLSHQFAKSNKDKFEGVSYQAGIEGIPLLDHCASNFECVTHQRIEVGDHILFLGRVEQYRHHDEETLLFCQGQYAKSSPLLST